MVPTSIFWYILAALLVRDLIFEVYQFSLGLLLNYRAEKQAAAYRQQIAEQLGVPVEQLQFLSTGPEGEGFARILPTVSGSAGFLNKKTNSSSLDGHGHYL